MHLEAGLGLTGDGFLNTQAWLTGVHRWPLESPDLPISRRGSPLARAIFIVRNRTYQQRWRPDGYMSEPITTKAQVNILQFLTYSIHVPNSEYE